MPFAAFHVSNQIDATGIATFVLALATAALAWWTRREVTQSATEVERGHRPVLVPVIDYSQHYSIRQDRTVYLAPMLDEGIAARPLHLPVRNVGMGPALRVSANVLFGERGSSVRGMANAHVAGISHTAPWALLTFRDTPDGDPVGFQLLLEYEDVAGKRWRTDARYDLDRAVYGTPRD